MTQSRPSRPARGQINGVDEDVAGGTIVGMGVGGGVGDVVFPEQETMIVRPRMATARRAGRNDSRLLTARSLLLSRQNAATISHSKNEWIQSDHCILLLTLAK